MNYLPYLDYKHPVKQKWQDVFVKMRVHTQGYAPTEIFKARRPEASKDPNELDYRKKNFKPTTKSLFDLAIEGYQETAMLLDIAVTGSDKDAIEQEIKVRDGLKELGLREWYIKKVGGYRQTDPNSVVVVLPKHPEEKLVPSFKGTIPDFNKTLTKRIELDIRLIPSYNIIYLDFDSVVFKAGTWLWGIEDKVEKYEPYYFALDKDYTYIIYPIKGEKKGEFKYKQEAYYFNNLEVSPVIPVGGKEIIEEEECETIQYYDSDFSGAAAWGDKHLGQDSDLHICETRFTYIEKWMIKKRCDQMDSVWHDGVHVCASDHNQICGTCKGSGFMADTSPMGTHLLEKSEAFTGLDGSGTFIEPLGYIAPPSDILKHSAERTGVYYDNAQSELGIIKQNMTDASGVSKAFDVAQKVTRFTIIVVDLYRGLEHLYKVCQGYWFKRSDIEIDTPENIDVKNANDLSIELGEMKRNGAAHADLVETNERLMLKKYGDTAFNRWAQGVLSKYDKLYPYSLEEIKSMKAIYGDDLTLFDINLHYYGYQILKEMYRMDDNVVNNGDVLPLLQAEVQKYMPVISEPIEL